MLPDSPEKDSSNLKLTGAGEDVTVTQNLRCAAGDDCGMKDRDPPPPPQTPLINAVTGRAMHYCIFCSVPTQLA